MTTPYMGYAVAIPHPTHLKKYVRKNFFGLRKKPEEYLAAAIAWRDQQHFALYHREVPKRVFHRQQNNSRTDTAGVRYLEKILKKKLKDGSIAQYRVPCIIAEVWTKPGCNYARTSGSRSKIFSIKKYGEAEAIRLATDWRKQMESLLASGLDLQ